MFPLQKRLYFCLIALILFSFAARIALRSKYGAHPDESAHVEAFSFFQTNWRPLQFPEGIPPEILRSRIYSGEVVYAAYGKAAWLGKPLLDPLIRGLNPETESLRNLNPQTPRSGAAEESGLAHAYETHVFRVFNAVLLFVTQLALLHFGRRHSVALGIAMVFLTVPQLIYVYSYANSDAFGMSLSALFAAFVLARHERSPLTWLDVAVIAALAALTLRSKSNYWVSLLLPCLLLLARVSDWPLLQKMWRPALAKTLAAIAFVALVVFLMGLMLPRGQFGLLGRTPVQTGASATRIAELREKCARGVFRARDYVKGDPSLRSLGVGLGDVARDPEWHSRSFGSFYGCFGNMIVPVDGWVYSTAMASAIALIVFAVVGVSLAWRTISRSYKVVLLASPLSIALSVGASLCNSWTYDWQPQGRYLLPALIPLGLVLGAALEFAPRWVRPVLLACWLPLAVLCPYVLDAYVLRNPFLTV